MLVPRPRRSAPADRVLDGSVPDGFVPDGFVLTESSAITADTELASVAAWLQDALRPATGLPLPVRPIAGRVSGSIRLAIDDALADEGYRLRIDADGVDVIGGGAAGVFYGCQSLVQLLPAAVHRRARVTDAAWRLPAVDVDDAPRFGWRGAMLDVARHFLPKREVLRFIDLMAAHKLNRLHFHLTDDQGWRIEIPRHPRLTEVGAWRRESQVGAIEGAAGDGRPHGGFYTQDDLREIVAYAAERFVTVVPEVESPGHVQAAIAAYPHLGVDDPDVEVWTGWGISEVVLNAEESTVRFFCDVLDDVMDLFPGPYVGIGGDECPRVQWRASARVQERMRELGLDDEADVQSWFMGRLADHLRARGRRAFGWDELLEGEPPRDAVVASWRGSAGVTVAARLGYDVVACPDDVVYLDYRQSDGPDEPIPVSVPITVLDAYRFDPVPADLSSDEAAHVLGGQANLWSEYMDSPRTVDFFAFPRLAAVAEALWSGPGGDEGDFLRRLDGHLARLDAMGVEYRHADGPRPWQRRPGIPGRPETRAERETHVAALVAQLPRV